MKLFGLTTGIAKLVVNRWPNIAQLLGFFGIQGRRQHGSDMFFKRVFGLAVIRRFAHVLNINRLKSRELQREIALGIFQANALPDRQLHR